MTKAWRGNQAYRVGHKWPAPYLMDGGFVHRTRVIWEVPAGLLARRAKLHQNHLARFEAGKIELPWSARLMVWVSLRQLVTERMMTALDDFEDVAPYARRRLHFLAVNQAHRAAKAAEGKKTRALPPPHDTFAPPPDLPEQAIDKNVAKRRLVRVP